LLADKLEMAGWKTWPVEERAAVLSYFQVFRQVAPSDDSYDTGHIKDVDEAIARLT